MNRKKILMLLSNYHPETHRGIARAAKDFGWHLNISLQNSFQVPTHWNGDGIICSLDNNKKIEDFVVNSKLPCVDLSGWRIDLGFPRVAVNNQVIGKLAAEHFCTFGHRSFGWFAHQDNPVAQARYESFRDELIARELPAPSQLIGDRTQNISEIQAWLSQLEKPSALFAYNDNDAAWLLSSCIDLGYRVPQDFSILGVDNNSLICTHQPVPLSSINHAHEEIGYMGATLLNQIIDGNAPAEQTIYIKSTGVTQRASSDSLATHDPLVRQTISILKQQLHKPIGAPEISSRLGISRRNLEVRFKQALGTSIHKKLVEMRLKQAEILLADTDLTIEDIAAQVGFCNSPHLCRSFKNQYDLSPLAYRKANQQQQTP